MPALPGHVPGLTTLGTVVQWKTVQRLPCSTWNVIFELQTVLDKCGQFQSAQHFQSVPVLQVASIRYGFSVQPLKDSSLGTLSLSSAKVLELCRVNILAHLRRTSKIIACLKKNGQASSQQCKHQQGRLTLTHLYNSSPHTAHCP